MSHITSKDNQTRRPRRKRPDVMVKIDGDIETLAIDVTSALPKIDKRGRVEAQNDAVEKREEDKRKKREQRAKESGMSLIPFVLVGPFAVLSQLAKRTINRINRSGPRQEFSQRRKVFFQACAAALIA